MGPIIPVALADIFSVQFVCVCQRWKRRIKWWRNQNRNQNHGWKQNQRRGGGGGWIGAGTGTRNLGGGSRVLMQAKWCAPVSPVPLEEYKITHPPDMGGPPHSPGPTYLQELAPVWNVL